MDGDIRAVMEEIRAAIAAEKKRECLRPGEFTSSMYAEDMGISAGAARRELQYGVNRGIIAKRKSAVGGNMNIYRMVEKEE